MKLEKVIEILEKEKEDTFMGSEEEWKAALGVAIEALLTIKNGRIAGQNPEWLLLPGETLDR